MHPRAAVSAAYYEFFIWNWKQNVDHSIPMDT